MSHDDELFEDGSGQLEDYNEEGQESEPPTRSKNPQKKTAVQNNAPEKKGISVVIKIGAFAVVGVVVFAVVFFFGQKGSNPGRSQQGFGQNGNNAFQQTQNSPGQGQASDFAMPQQYPGQGQQQFPQPQPQPVQAYPQQVQQRVPMPGGFPQAQQPQQPSPVVASQIQPQQPVVAQMPTAITPAGIQQLQQNTQVAPAGGNGSTDDRIQHLQDEVDELKKEVSEIVRYENHVHGKPRHAMGRRKNRHHRNVESDYVMPAKKAEEVEPKQEAVQSKCQYVGGLDNRAWISCDGSVYSVTSGDKFPGGTVKSIDTQNGSLVTDSGKTIN